MIPYVSTDPARLAQAALTALSLRDDRVSDAEIARVLLAWYPDVRAWPSLPISPGEASELAETVLCTLVDWQPPDWPNAPWIDIHPHEPEDQARLGRDIVRYRATYPATGDRYWGMVDAAAR